LSVCDQLASIGYRRKDTTQSTVKSGRCQHLSLKILLLTWLLSACSVPQAEPVMRLDQGVGGAMSTAVSNFHDISIVSNVKISDDALTSVT